MKLPLGSVFSEVPLQNRIVVDLQANSVYRLWLHRFILLEYSSGTTYTYPPSPKITLVCTFLCIDFKEKNNVFQRVALKRSLDH